MLQLSMSVGEDVRFHPRDWLHYKFSWSQCLVCGNSVKTDNLDLENTLETASSYICAFIFLLEMWKLCSARLFIFSFSNKPRELKFPRLEILLCRLYYILTNYFKFPFNASRFLRNSVRKRRPILRWETIKLSECFVFGMVYYSFTSILAVVLVYSRPSGIKVVWFTRPSRSHHPWGA